MKMVKKQPLSLSMAQDAAAYYAFNMDGNNGYVIVSGSDLAPCVLAFSEKGSFMEEKLPTNMKAWLQGYADQIAYLEHTAGKYEMPRLLTRRNAVSPLLKSTWYQETPYNNKCPVDPSTGNHCATGCVATAMAQVIYYYKYPSQTKAVIPSYTTETKGISMSEIGITTIDWNNMLDNYSSSTTTSQKNAVAQLMLLCGQALGMDYNYPESGIKSSNMPLEAMALQRYFGYDQTVRALDRNAFSTLEWESLIYDEVAAGRPVLYNGLSSGGGHAFVVDGYDGEGLFHVNWGWNGNSDGYFALSILNPYNTTSTGASSSHDGFSIDQSAVVGIQHGTEDVIAERFQVTDIKVTGSTSYTRSSISEDFTGISIQPTAWNLTGDNHSFVLGLTLMDENDNWVTGVFNGVNYGSQDFLYGGSYNFEDCSFGSNIPDGVYYIVPVSASENSDIWEPCWRSNVYRIKATINGNSLTLTEPSTNLSGTMQVTSQAVVGDPLSITAQITNNGSYFNDYVYLFEPNEEDKLTMVGGRMLEAQEGETVNFNIDYVPMAAGSKTLVLVCYDKNNKAQIIGHTTATIGKCLDYTVSITNAVNGIVADGKVSAKVNVLNNGNLYNDEVALVLFKYNESANTYYYEADKTRLLTLSSGANTTLSFEFDNLEMEKKYVLSFQYFKANKLHDHGGYAYFSTKISELKLSLNANPDGGVISYMQEIKLTASNPNAEIYCTFDGTEPTKNDFLYDPPLQIDHSLTLKAKAFLDGYEDSETLMREYQVKLDIEADRASGTVRAGQTISLSSSHPEAAIYYTTDGSTPTKGSKVYKDPIEIGSSTIIKAIAMYDGCLSSDVLTRNYVVTAVKLSVSPNGSTVSKGTKVTITPTPENADIFYTLDGSEPNVLSEIYEEPINIQKNTTLKAIAYAEGYAESNLLTANYTVKLNLQASQTSGYVDYMSEVVLSTDEPDANIYYTTDGSTPTKESIVYNSPIVIDETMTIKAIAYHDDYLTSDVLTRNYTIQTVTLSIAPSTSELLPAGTEITLTANPANAKIYFTTDGSEPSESSMIYASPIIARKSMTLKAKAFYEGYKASHLVENNYQITSLFADNSISNVETKLNRHSIPFVKYNLAIREGLNFSQIQLVNLKNGDVVPGKSLIVDSTFYFIPDMDFETGQYLLKIPQSSFVNKENEYNISSQYNITIESIDYDSPKFYGNSAGQVFVIKTDKSLWGWGESDSHDPIGDGSTNRNYTIDNPCKIMENAKEMFMYYGQLVLKDDKSVWSWGNNNYYPLGINSNRQSVLKPTKVMDNVLKVATTYTHTLFVKGDNSCWGCGLQIRGAVGNGSSATFVPTPVKIMENVKDIAVDGSEESSNALKNDNSLWAWGQNTPGLSSAGYYIHTTKTSPVRVMEDVSSLLGVRMVIKNDNHSLWVDHWDGQSNTSTIMNDVKTAYSDAERQFALKNDSTLWSWGKREVIARHADGSPDEYYVDLGYYTEELVPYTPRKILDNVVSFSVARYGSNAHVLAIKNDWTLWSWGINSLGQVGNGSQDAQIEPVKVMDSVLYAYALPRESYVIKVDGSVWHWGNGITTPQKSNMVVFVDDVFLKGIRIPSTCTVEQSKLSFIPLDLGRTNADYETMVWKSSDESIATVSSRGIVTGIAPGEAILTVKVTSKEGTEFTAQCIVTVTENIKGDVNGDNIVDREDAIAVANYILKKPSPSFNPTAADVNGDGIINITDAIAIENIIKQNK